MEVTLFQGRGGRIYLRARDLGFLGGLFTSKWESEMGGLLCENMGLGLHLVCGERDREGESRSAGWGTLAE